MFSSVKRVALAGVLALGALVTTGTTQAEARECFIGEIAMFGGNFAPRGWALADGQILSISSNSALFSIFGTTYGGDGRTTFALPDLRGRAPIHAGTGPGLSPRRLGSRGGSETNTLSIAQLPAHSHALNATTDRANTSNPTGTLLGNTGRDDIYVSAAPGTALSSASISATGGGSSVNNMQPYQAINYIVCLVGVFPSRS